MGNTLKYYVTGAVLAFGLTAGGAQALTMTAEACDLGSVSGATACAGIFSGNNSNQDLNGLFGVANWGTEYKIDASFGSVSFAGTTLSVSNASPTGNADQDLWSLAGAGTYNSLMFVLKGGPTFSAFLMDTSTFFGSWNRNSMANGNGSRGAELSHWSVYVAGNGTPPSTVPLPAAVWMLLAGLGGLGLTRFRKA